VTCIQLQVSAYTWQCYSSWSS